MSARRDRWTVTVALLGLMSLLAYWAVLLDMTDQINDLRQRQLADGEINQVAILADERAERWREFAERAWDELCESIRDALPDVDMVVMRCPTIWVDTAAFPAFVATCPHGVTWIAEPSGEQHAKWVSERIP